jgi:hypothetical protein
VHYIKEDKGLFQFYHTPTLMWDDEDEEEEEHGMFVCLLFFFPFFVVYVRVELSR